jgi:alpha-glucosidase
MIKNLQKTPLFFSVIFGLLLLPAGLMAQTGAAPQSAGWHSLGAMPAPVWDGKTLLFHNEQGTLAVTPLSDDVIRIHFAAAPALGRDHSYAVINRDLGAPQVKVSAGPVSTLLQTASIKLTVQHTPLRISIASLDGKILAADGSQGGIALSGDGAFRVTQNLAEDEHLYGLGEKNGSLDKRGWKLGGYNYVMWNSDTYAYNSSTDPIYVSVPFFLATRQGAAYGIFLDNTWRSFFDIGHERQDTLTFGAEGGDLDYYFINGPSPKQVIERYTALTGRTPLPPLWALGFNQCRYSYYPEARVRLLADTFRQKQIPADVIWLDIHYQDNYKPFTWDHERFPDPAKLISDLRNQGFRVVTIVDAHPKKEKGYAPYDQGIAGNFFVKNPDGSVYEAPVWPARADHNPGPSVFPDFTRADVRQWWGNLYKSFLDIGVAGIWNDMNEPAIFDTPTGTMPADVVFDNEGHATTHREIHNVYGQLMSRATFEGLARLRPNERPFVLTRATFAGGQRYAAVWPGDNTSDWSSLRQSVSTLLGLGVSGFPFVGCDIGGFVGAPSGELYTRWLQAGVFFPFMRSHSTFGSPDKEPWSFDFNHEIINRHAIELRYQLLPYIYNAMQRASETGVPALRPLFLDFPGDENAASIEDEFLLGDDLLVAPVLTEGVTDREVYLPKGDWFDYWTGRQFAGGQSIHLPVTLDSIPMFVRGGGFIFRQPVVQSTGEMPGKPLRVLVAPSAQSESSLYEDDGATLDYRKGASVKRILRQSSADSMSTIEISAPEGVYRPAARDLILETWAAHEPESVSFQSGTNTIAMLHLDAGALVNSPEGWAYAEHLLTMKIKDRFEPVRITIHRTQ